MKRIRIREASPSQKAVMAEPAKGKEAFQMSKGGKGVVWLGRKPHKHEMMVEVSQITSQGTRKTSDRHIRSCRFHN